MWAKKIKINIGTGREKYGSTWLCAKPWLQIGSWNEEVCILDCFNV